MEKQEPLVSILMPVYNTEIFLEESIDSVIDQSYKNWELICVDDGSTDNSLIILEKFRLKDHRITVIHQENGGTASGARNKGLSVASGKFIVLLDSDDKIEKDYIIKLVQKSLSSNASLIISSTHFWRYKENRIARSIEGVDGNLDVIISGKQAFLYSLKWRIGGMGLYRTDVLRSIGGYDVEGVNGDEYTTRLLFLKSNFVAFSDAQYFYRYNQASTTKRFSVRRFELHATNHKLYNLVKSSNFDLDITIEEKKKLLESLFSNYLIYIVRGKELTKDELQKAKSLLIKNTGKMQVEFSERPLVYSHLQRAFYSFILRRWEFTYLYSFYKGTVNSLKAKFLNAISKNS
jgi:glycosyltransferase involved in cell wall biosynthesis